MWCESICLSWVDSPYLGNGSGKLLGSSERKWGVAGELSEIRLIAVTRTRRLHIL